MTAMSMSALTARTGNCATRTSSTTASPVTTWTYSEPTPGVTSVYSVDVDAFLLAHRGTWDRLEQLVKNRRRLDGAEVDELVDLYQRASTHLSMLRSASTIGSDSLMIGRLSSLIARARSAVT